MGQWVWLVEILDGAVGVVDVCALCPPSST